MKNNFSETATSGRSDILSYRQVKTYLILSLLVTGNILLPGLFHYVPQGGLIFLPIYFFTLLGAYKYGWKAGLLIGFLSPVINYLLTGMPTITALPVILIKSLLLAVSAAYGAKHAGKISISALMAIVLFYQGAGMFAEWLLHGNFSVITQHFALGLPGMFLQVTGGYSLLKLMEKYGY